MSVICPKAKGFARSFEVLEDVHIYRYRLPVDAQGALGFVAEFLWCFARTAMKSVRVAVAGRGFDVLHVCNPLETLLAAGPLLKRFLGKRFLFDHHDLSPEMYQAKFGSQGGRGRAAVPGAQDLRDGRPGDHHNQSHRRIAIALGREGARRRIWCAPARPRAPDRLPADPAWRKGQAPPGRLPGRDLQAGRGRPSGAGDEAAPGRAGPRRHPCVLVGGGPHQPSIKAYAEEIGVAELCAPSPAG